MRSVCSEYVPGKLVDGLLWVLIDPISRAQRTRAPPKRKVAERSEKGVSRGLVVSPSEVHELYENGSRCTLSAVTA